MFLIPGAPGLRACPEQSEGMTGGGCFLFDILLTFVRQIGILSVYWRRVRKLGKLSRPKRPAVM
jgi:hypothetical protein